MSARGFTVDDKTLATMVNAYIATNGTPLDAMRAAVECIHVACPPREELARELCQAAFGPGQEPIPGGGFYNAADRAIVLLRQHAAPKPAGGARFEVTREEWSAAWKGPSFGGGSGDSFNALNAVLARRPAADEAEALRKRVADLEAQLTTAEEGAEIDGCNANKRIATLESQLAAVTAERDDAVSLAEACRAGGFARRMQSERDAALAKLGARPEPVAVDEALAERFCRFYWGGPEQASRAADQSTALRALRQVLGTHASVSVPSPATPVDDATIERMCEQHQNHDSPRLWRYLSEGERVRCRADMRAAVAVLGEVGSASASQGDSPVRRANDALDVAGVDRGLTIDRRVQALAEERDQLRVEVERLKAELEECQQQHAELRTTRAAEHTALMARHEALREACTWDFESRGECGYSLAEAIEHCNGKGYSCLTDYLKRIQAALQPATPEPCGKPWASDPATDGVSGPPLALACSADLQKRVEAWRRWALEWRGIDAPCTACGGAGQRAYASTATWQGGIGGAAITSDVCDRCWGTGDAHRKGADLRAMTAERRAWEAEQCARWLGERIGASLSTMRPQLLAVAAALQVETRRRKAPCGVELFWYQRAVETVIAAVTELAGKDVSAAGAEEE